MPTFRLPPDAILNSKNAARRIKKTSLDSFNPSVLGLGDIDQQSRSISAIAALFDLQGFTTFCRQIEPHLSIPVFLNSYLMWIFDSIRNETLREEKNEEALLWHDLPFLTKFMGDGLLILWDTENMGAIAQHNLITSLLEICGKYESDFYPMMKKKVVDAPPRLRCGVAKGTVFSVGNGDDYVGSCINMAARLQKLHGLRFAFARRGFDPETQWDETTLDSWLLKSISIRGIGDHELIYARKKDFESLSKEDKANFHSV
ncbi:MAG: hypothetical protein WC637_13110 [Victivallales bacterium]|jgi:hypothetical protein